MAAKFFVGGRTRWRDIRDPTRDAEIPDAFEALQDLLANLPTHWPIAAVP